MACKGFRAQGAGIGEERPEKAFEAKEARVCIGRGQALQWNQAAWRRGDAGRGGPKAMRDQD